LEDKRNSIEKVIHRRNRELYKAVNKLDEKANDIYERLAEISDKYEYEYYLTKKKNP